VEDTLFRVPRWGFEEPECFFADMFKSALPGPGPNGEQVEGTSDDSPIVMEGESKFHFRAFLKALYSRVYKVLPDPRKPYDASLDRKVDISGYDEWLGVLHLATKWNFTSMRKKAISEVERCFPRTKLTIWEKMDIARKYNVREWLVKEYEALVNQDASHNVAALFENLDISGVQKVLQLREDAFRGRQRVVEVFADDINSVGT
ncbi:hypothetical protein CPC08DRAFT_709866, partial [Agrocybe pediades]